MLLRVPVPSRSVWPWFRLSRSRALLGYRRRGPHTLRSGDLGLESAASRSRQAVIPSRACSSRTILSEALDGRDPVRSKRPGLSTGIPHAATTDPWLEGDQSR